ncbi:MAG: barstar family protein [Thermoleophilia bacterium]
MKRITIDLDKIRDKESFHDVFAETFGFLEGYGRNMDAWIDCMTNLDEPLAGLSKITCEKGDYFVLELNNIKQFHKRCPNLFDDIIECSAFVNWRRLERGNLPLLMLSFYS